MERKIELADGSIMEEYSAISDGTSEVFGIAFYKEATPDEGVAEFFDSEAARSARFNEVQGAMSATG